MEEICKWLYILWAQDRWGSVDLIRLKNKVSIRACCKQHWSSYIQDVEVWQVYSVHLWGTLFTRWWTLFVHTLGSLRVRAEDLMVSFNVASLFTQMLIAESLNLLSHFSEDILALFRHVLTSTYFSVGGQFYEQTDGVATLCPVILISLLRSLRRGPKHQRPTNRCAGSIMSMSFLLSGHME
jgi:hypothetical protein